MECAWLDRARQQRLGFGELSRMAPNTPADDGLAVTFFCVRINSTGVPTVCSRLDFKVCWSNALRPPAHVLGASSVRGSLGGRRGGGLPADHS